MASALDTKINSYTLEKGTEFSSAVSTTTPQTGSITAKTLVTSQAALIAYETNTGPTGGAGCWKFTMSGTEAGPVSAPRVIYNTAAQYDVFKDGDYSGGFWWKLNTQMVSARNSTLFTVSPASLSASGLIISYRGTTAPADAGKLVVNYTDVINIPISGVIVPNTWYYIAFNRINTTTTDNFKVYINGVNTFSANWSPATPAGLMTQMRFGDTNSYANYSWSISNFYYTTSSPIGPTEISQIYSAGLGTVVRTVKYYNGTAWVNSSAQKVYNGTAWVDWNAKKYDGTAWVTI